MATNARTRIIILVAFTKRSKAGRATGGTAKPGKVDFGLPVFLQTCVVIRIAEE
jgi:hypothetical protein